MNNPSGNYNSQNCTSRYEPQGSIRDQENSQCPFPSSRNKMWCQLCRRVFSCLDVHAFQSACPYCRNIGYSLINSRNSRSNRMEPETREVMQPRLRPFLPSQALQPFQPPQMALTSINPSMAPVSVTNTPTQIMNSNSESTLR